MFDSLEDIKAKYLSNNDTRYIEIIQVTEGIIAERGFEGLRIREIAEKIGVNNGTIHYYFKTKEILIQEVVKHIVVQLLSTHNPARHQQPTNPREELEAHFDDIIYQLQHFPARFVVLSEVYMRALRHPEIRIMLEKVDEDWLSYLVGIINHGIDENVFQKNTNAVVTSSVIMMILKGAQLQLATNHLHVQKALNAVIDSIS